jgi:hypothetical protein
MKNCIRLAGPAAATALALGTLAAPAQGGLIQQGLYRLGNHPDNNEVPPPYGLRLDELFDKNPGEHDVFTFDFEADGAEMFLDYDGTTIHIYGTAFGGLDIGGAYDPDNSSFVEIDFTFGEIMGVPGDDDVFADGNPGGDGTLTWLETNEVIALASYPTGDGDEVFRFGNENDDLGHRGFDGISGWGWLTHGSGEHVEFSDWTFTAEFIPAPGVMALLGIGLLCPRRRRR